ncbi:MAG: hypothetical protein AAFR79_00785 [Pseudomonadota bacterium]
MNVNIKQTTSLNAQALSNSAIALENQLDALHRLSEEAIWPVINRLSPKYRSEMAARTIAKYAPDIVAELDALYHCKGAFYRIVRLPKLYDGDRDTLVSIQMGILQLLRAIPLGYLEGEGRIDRPVKAIKGHENRQSTTGTRKFGPHIDHAAARFPWQPPDGRHAQPDWLLLGTVNNPKKVGTWFADPIAVYNKLVGIDEQAALDLERSEATLPMPPSVRPAKVAAEIPIIERDPQGMPAIRAYPRAIAETERMERALKVLNAVLLDQALWTEIALEPGETVVARGTALHKRGPVSAERELTAMYGREIGRHEGAVCSTYPYLEHV